MTGLIQDFRLAARMLRKTPGFTLAAVISLALGIGANTAIFQLINAVRLKTLPVLAPQELAQVRIAGDMTGARGSFSFRYITSNRFPASWPGLRRASISPRAVKFGRPKGYGSAATSSMCLAFSRRGAGS